MDKFDWMDDIAERMEGYGESAPEGLWDAVTTGYARLRRRRRAAWTACGAVFAAAAVVLGIFLWQPSGSLSDTPVPETLLASNDTPSPDSPNMASAEKSADSDGVFSAVQNVDLKDQNPRETAPSGPADGPQGTVASSETSRASSSETPTSVEKPLLSETPATRVPLEKKSRRSLRVEGALSTGGLIAQNISSSSTSVGIPAVPGRRAAAPDLTKAPGPGTGAASGLGASSAGGTGASPASLLSRNRTSTTDATHSQSARLAASVRLYLTDRWALETGLVRTELQSTFTTTAGSNTTRTERTLTYIGVPIYANYDFVTWKGLRLYAVGGPMFEVCTSQRSDTYSYMTGSAPTSTDSDDSPYEDRKWSLNLGVGAQYRLFSNCSAFLQPGIAWYIPDNSTLESWYTERPFSPSLTLGLRFSW